MSRGVNHLRRKRLGAPAPLPKLLCEKCAKDHKPTPRLIRMRMATCQSCYRFTMVGTVKDETENAQAVKQGAPAQAKGEGSTGG